MKKKRKERKTEKRKKNGEKKEKKRKRKTQKMQTFWQNKSNARNLQFFALNFWFFPQFLNYALWKTHDSD
jgi:hypothetical protein